MSSYMNVLNQIETNETMDDCFQVTLTRSSLHGFGFGINHENTNIDIPSLTVSDVMKNGPAYGKLLPNDRIINVNGHPVVRHMEYIALKLVHESTDFVHLIIQRDKSPMIGNQYSHDLPVKYILNKFAKDEKFEIELDCRYFVKKIHNKNLFKNIDEGDEILKINDIPIKQLSLQDAQKIIDKTRDQVVIHTKPHHCPMEKKPTHSLNNPEFIRSNIGRRVVSFVTDTTSIGIRLAGGNKYGLFVCEIQPNSVAHKAGLFIADKIFSVNDVDFMNITREEAVLYLLNMKSTQINMIVSNLQYEYEQLLADIGGDSFYIRAYFTYNPLTEDELSIHINDIFHVTDTLYNGQVGYWVVTKLNGLCSQEKVTGVIPNRIRAEQLIDEAPSLDQIIKMRHSSFKKKLRTKFNDKRLRFTLLSNNLKEDSIIDKITCWKPMINSRHTTYERVKLKSITIIRPVVLLGALADIARDCLLDRYPDQYELPEIHMQSTDKTNNQIIRLKSIKHVIDKNRHCLLDITPSAIEQLNHTECYPIVIYFKMKDRRILKDIRNQFGKIYQKSSRRLFDICEQMEYFYSYLFTSTIEIKSETNWFETLKSQIEFEQNKSIWMNYDQMNSNDLLKSDEYFLSTQLIYPNELSLFEKSNSDIDIRNKTSLERAPSDSVMFLKNASNENLNISQEKCRIVKSSTISIPQHSRSLLDIPTRDQERFSRQNFVEKRPTIDSYGTWNKSKTYCPTILLNQADKQTSFINLNENLNHSIEKPRVFTYDDRNSANQQQPNVSLSSSSMTSTLTSKDKKLNREPGEMRSFAVQDGCNVIGSARGIMNYYGGKLSCPLTGVSMFVPMGAIPEGVDQEIYFQVYQNDACVDKYKSQLLSPIVICGPQGVQFQKPIELTLPHRAGNNPEQLSLMLHGSHQNDKMSENRSLSMHGINRITNSNVSILIDHF